MPTLDEIEAELARRQQGLSLWAIESELAMREAEQIPMGEGLALSALSGVSLNFGDELVAGLLAVPGAIATGRGVGETYDDILFDLREKQRKFREQAPVASFAAELGGGMLTGGAGAVKGLGQSGMSLATRTALSGAATGGLAGAGAGEDLEQRLDLAGKGAAIGGAFGAATPVIQKAGIKAGSFTKDALKRAFTAQESRALRTLASKMDASDIDTVKAAAMIRKGGENASLSDLEIYKGVSKALASDPSQAKVMAKGFLTSRLRGSKERLRSMIQTKTGSAIDNVEESVEEITAQMRKRANPLYNEAYTVGLSDDVNNKLMSIADNKDIERALKEAFNDISNDLRLDPSFKNGISVENPNIVMWDYAQRSLADRAETLLRAGKKNKAGSILDKKNRIVEALHTNEMMKQARTIWRGGNQALEALEFGQNVFKEGKKVGAAALRKQFAKLNPYEKDLAKLGMGSEMNLIINNTPDTLEGRPALSMFKQIYGDDTKKAAVGLLFDDNRRDIAQFARKIRNEREYIKTANDVLGNSSTTEKLAEQAALQADISGAAQVAEGLKSGNPFQAASSVLRAVARVVDGKKATDATNRELARRLFTSDSDLILDTLEGIRRESNILPEWADKLVTQKSLSDFLSSPDNQEKLSLFLSGTLSGRIMGLPKQEGE